jgi:hypothetical protein
MELDGDATNENLLKSYLGPKGDKVRPVPLSSSPPPAHTTTPFTWILLHARRVGS